MKHIFIFISLLSVLIIPTVLWSQTNIEANCMDCPTFMPDNFVDTFGIIVCGAANNDLAHPVQRLCKVNISFDHEYLGDLSMDIISPAGQVVKLVGPVGLFGETNGTSWDIGFVPCSEVPQPDPTHLAVWSNMLWSVGETGSGTYHPVSGCLEAFNTGPVNGIWRVAVLDNQAQDVGNLLDISLEFCDDTPVDSLSQALPLAQGQVSALGNWGVTLKDLSLDAAGIEIDWDDNSLETIQQAGSSLSHNYMQTGLYNVRITAINCNGSDDQYFPVEVVGGPPTASFEIVPFDSICVGDSYSIKVINPVQVDMLEWEFPKGQIAAVGGTTFNLPAQFEAISDTVLLRMSNSFGATEVNFPLWVFDIPQATFETFINGNGNYTFVANDTNVDSTVWIINGQVVATNIDTLNYASNASDLLVEHIVYNYCGVDAAVTNIFVDVVELAPKGAEINIAPNPTQDGWIGVRSAMEFPSTANWEIVNTLGQSITTGVIDLPAGRQTRPIHVGDLPVGQYFLLVNAASFAKRVPFMVK